jgi:hypothetical protein
LWFFTIAFMLKNIKIKETMGLTVLIIERYLYQKNKEALKYIRASCKSFSYD